MRSMNGKGDKKRLILLIVLVLLICFAAAVAGIMIYNNKTQSGGKNYQKSISEAERYISEENYDQAIHVLKQVISDNPGEAEGYYQLAQVYELQNNIPGARNILEIGFYRTKSDRLSDYLKRLGQTEMNEDKAAEANEAVLDDIFLGDMQRYTYDDFNRNYSSGTVDTAGSDGFTHVTYENPGIVTYFRNTASNQEILSSNGVPNPGSFPEMIYIERADLVFRNLTGHIEKKEIQSIVGHVMEIETNESGDPYIEIPLNDTTLRVMCTEEGVIHPDTHCWLYLPQVSEEEEKGIVTGSVIDAMTGKGLAGVKVTASANGINETATTDQSGKFKLELPGGIYTLKFEKNGYAGVEGTATSITGRTIDAGQYVMSPNVNSGEMRIVLTWSSAPADLDLHLNGTMDDGTNMDIYYSHMRQMDTAGNIAANLDVDDRNGGGPETITIYNLNGVYDCYVLDYLMTGETGAIGTAVVTVYKPDGSVETINVNPEVTDLWHVIHIDHGQVTVINEAVS